jgi:hypothetical protein
VRATPHVASFSPSPHRCNAIDGRTTHHPTDAASQQKRKLVEEGFG